MKDSSLSRSYSPPHYTSDQHDVAKGLFTQFELAILISPTSVPLQISHLPLVLSKHNGQDCFLGHMARMNPHWKVFKEQSRATVIFRGPDHYISPAWYKEDDENVPTWNYAAAHLEGRIELVEQASEILTVVQEQVEWWESRLGTNWKLNPHLEPIRNLSRGIIAFRFYPESEQLKFKLSQKQPADNWETVVKSLKALGSERASQTAEFMKATRKD